MKKLIAIILAAVLTFSLMACAGQSTVSTASTSQAAATESQSESQSEATSDESDENTEDTAEQAQEKSLNLMIGDTEVAVEWEDNESVEKLKELISENPISISMSMYGGFEQVGALGTTLVSNDVQTATSAGDIVLYSSSQIVIFYGSNSWAYTRLGRITGKSAAEMGDLLGNGDVTVTIFLE